MDYAIIQPPFTLKFAEMSKNELKEYFAWFQNILPQRLGELTGAVHQTPGFENWRADFTENSLNQLGEWFVLQAKTRTRTEKETQEIASYSSYPIDIPNEELTNRTFSLAIDIGMYISRVFLKSRPTLCWDQLFGNKKHIDYGQPVLKGFGAVPFNPVRMMVTLAYSITSGQSTSSSLREIYDIWAKMIRD